MVPLDRAALVVPFRDRFQWVVVLLESVLSDLPGNCRIVLVDDGSAERAEFASVFMPHLQDARVHLLTHETGEGASAARNTAIAWCRAHDFPIIIFLDSDCIPPPHFVTRHLALHQRHPDAAGIGGSIAGEGSGFWARLDGAMSWCFCLPGSPARWIDEPVHLPTTNLSVKSAQLPDRDDVFDVRLRTGEDVAFAKDVRDFGGKFFFDPEIMIRHRDRETLAEFLHHQMRWSFHTYAVRFGRRKDTWGRRFGFCAIFLAGSPIYVCYAAFLNTKPLVSRRPMDWKLLPLIVVMYGLKALGVIAGTLVPTLAVHSRTPFSVMENPTHDSRPHLSESSLD